MQMLCIHPQINQTSDFGVNEHLIRDGTLSSFLSLTQPQTNQSFDFQVSFNRLQTTQTTSRFLRRNSDS
ncbi:hypothetical protein AtNW77_Chr5g0101771 [Arabidopsis thaliana]